jgi:phosphatidylglycerophosphate synthase
MAYDGIVSRYLNRPISRPTARALAHTPVTPNSVTIFTLLLSIATAAALATGWNIIGGIGIQLASIIDGVDGELARLRNTSTRFGAVLDAVADRYADAAIIAGLTIFAVRFEDYPRPEVIGALALAGTLIVSYSRARIEASLQTLEEESLSNSPSPVERERGPGGEGPVEGPLDSLFGLASRDVRSLIMAIGAVVGLAYFTLAIIATITAATIAYRLIYLRFTT